MKKLTLLLFFIAHLSLGQTSITKWSGILNAGGRKVEMILNMLPDTNGTFKSSWDIPAQKVKALSSTKTEWKNSSLAIEIKWIAAGFTGELSEDGKKITGNWGQAGQQFPLVLEPYVEGKNIPVVEKPQTPKAPFSYESREFVYQGAKTKLTYGATLTYPKEGGKHPFIVLITGSGAQDRDEAIFDHKPFAVLADFLTKNGFAVMRVDDRGVGKSNGVFQASTTGDFALDVEEHLNFAKQLPEVDSTKMGLLGHSEGGLIAPMVAARNKSVAFVILMAGPGVDIPELMAAQNEMVLKSVGVSTEAIQAYLPLYKGLMKTINEASSKSEATSKSTELVQDWFTKTDKTIVKNTTNISSEADIKTFVNPFVESLSTKWWKYFISYRPAPALEKLQIPVLAMNGSADIQVPAEANLKGIQAALKKAGNKRLTLKKFDGLNHMFQKCKACTVAEYGDLETTIEPEVLSYLQNWLENEKLSNFKAK
jgi:pimeloyl-ACP methyl ester carboxylesterase